VPSTNREKGNNNWSGDWRQGDAHFFMKNS